MKKSAHQKLIDDYMANFTKKRAPKKAAKKKKAAAKKK
jgi:hypothetical protein